VFWVYRAIQTVAEDDGVALFHQFVHYLLAVFVFANSHPALGCCVSFRHG
jgi:hypothetical protein